MYILQFVSAYFHPLLFASGGNTRAFFFAGSLRGGCCVCTRAFFSAVHCGGWFAFARGLVSLAGSPRVFLRCTRAFFLILYNSIFWGGRETSTLEAGFSPSPDPSLSSSTGACRCFLHETYFSLRSLRFGFCVLHTGLFFLILCNSFSGVGENSDWQQTCGLGFSQAYRFAVNCLL